MRLSHRLSPVVAMMVTLGMAASSFGSISGSKHDFGTYSWSQGQICYPCHTPHNAIVQDVSGNYVNGPLWNHQLSIATYNMFSAGGGAGTTGTVDQNSMLCLSCHDGTVGLDSFGGGANSGNKLTGPANFGTDLSNDHPIGSSAKWTYPTPSYMVDPTLRASATGGAIMPLRKMADGSDAVGCTTCHEPHNRKAVANMLWVNNAIAGNTVDGRAVSGSLLCMNCHKK